MPIKRKLKIGTMTENLGTPREKVTEQFGPETTEESESERIKRLAPAGSNLARTTMFTRGGTRFIEEIPPESYQEGLMSSLTPEKKALREQEQALMQEQLTKQQDLTAGETIGQAIQPITMGGVVEQQMTAAKQAAARKEVFFPIKLFLQESKAIIKTFGRTIGIGRKFQLSSAEIGSRYEKTINDIQEALDAGGDPLNAEQLLQDIEQDLARTASVIQTESKYDVGALIDGRLTDDQVKLAELQRQITFLRMRMQVQGLGGK